MSSATYKASYWAYGSTSYNTKTSVINVGKNSSGTYYYAYLRFAALPRNAVISSMKLTLYRTDTYQAVTLKFGCSASNAFGATLDKTVNLSVSNGANKKTLDITSLANTAKAYTGTYWYLHISHGSGSYSLAVFNSSSNTYMYVTIVYTLGTVWYFNGTEWVECLVYFRSEGAWVQCIPYYNSGGSWVQV